MKKETARGEGKASERARDSETETETERERVKKQHSEIRRHHTSEVKSDSGVSEPPVW